MLVTIPVVVSVPASLDCPNVVNFALGLGMDASNPAMSILKSDCCTSFFVVCDSNTPNRVKELNWEGFNPILNGFINGSALPTSLTHIRIERNEIQGKLPTTWPSGMIHIEVNKNRLYGDISLVQFPQSLETLQLGYPTEPGNQFSGTLYLYKPTVVLINYNWITDVQITDIVRLNRCDLSDNPLLGNSRANLATCTKNGLYAASLLPMTISKFKFSSARFSTTRILKTTTIQHQTTSEDLKTTVVFQSKTRTLKSLLFDPLLRSLYNTYLDSQNMTFDSDIMASTTTQQSDTSLPAAPSNQQGNNTNPGISQWVLIALFGGFVGLCILTFVASKIFKHPKIHSKFGRKNSFGTLNTMNTVKTTK